RFLEKGLDCSAPEGGQADLRDGGLLPRLARHLLLGTPALGDVDVRSVDADRPSGGVANDGGETEEDMDTAIRPYDAVLDVAAAISGDQLVMAAVDPFPVVWMEDGSIIVERRTFAALVPE